MTTKEFSDQFDVLLTSYLRFKKFNDKEILDSIEINEYAIKDNSMEYLANSLEFFEEMIESIT